MNYFTEKSKTLDKLYAPLQEAYEKRRHDLEHEKAMIENENEGFINQYRNNHDTLSGDITDLDFIENGNNKNLNEKYSRIIEVLRTRYRNYKYTVSADEKKAILKALKLDDKKESQLIDESWATVESALNQLERAVIEYRELIGDKEKFYRDYFVAMGEPKQFEKTHKSPSNRLFKIKEIYSNH